MLCEKDQMLNIPVIKFSTTSNFETVHYKMLIELLSKYWINNHLRAKTLKDKEGKKTF